MPQRAAENRNLDAPGAVGRLLSLSRPSALVAAMLALFLIAAGISLCCDLVGWNHDVVYPGYR